MPAPPCGNYGDVDGDGNVTMLDMQLANDMVLNPDNYTSEQKTIADVDGDGNVTMVDVALIYDFAMGSISTFPVCEMAVTLTWVRDHYDGNKSRYIERNEYLVAENDWKAGIITMGQYMTVNTVYADHIQLPAYYIPPPAEHPISFIVPTGATLKADGVEIL